MSTPPRGRVGRALSRLLLGAAEADRLASLHFDDAGHGYDAFGLNPRVVSAMAGLLEPLYRYYFRVESHGSENIPREGPAILAVNHSGMLPVDGTMLYLDVLHRTDPPRVPRAIGDVFIPMLPVVGTLFSRVGVVAGSSGNFRRLLESGELVLVFPEGTPGIGKGYDHRYELQDWRPGHAELAIHHRAPVVPVAIVGAEEAWPQIARIEGFHWFGAPWLPIPATPLPLPTKFRIRYGKPLLLHELWPPERAYEQEVSVEAAALVKREVQALIEQSLAERRGVFA